MLGRKKEGKIKRKKEKKHFVWIFELRELRLSQMQLFEMMSLSYESNFTSPIFFLTTYFEAKSEVLLIDSMSLNDLYSLVPSTHLDWL